MIGPKSARHIAFCERVLAGQKFGEAWHDSALDVRKNPGMGPSNNVSGSRIAAKYAEYIAALRKERADARNLNTQPVTRESIHALLETTTEALLAGSRAAASAGATNLSQQLNRLIVVHSGRQSRAAARAPKDETERSTFDSAPVLARLEWCYCDV